MPAAETPIFTRTFDLLAWLIPLTQRFPRPLRHTFTHRLLSSAFDFSEAIHRANLRRHGERLAALKQADEALNNLRHYIRLAHRLTLISPGQYEHAATLTAEIGKLLGGWQKITTPTS